MKLLIDFLNSIPSKLKNFLTKLNASSLIKDSTNIVQKSAVPLPPKLALQNIKMPRLPKKIVIIFLSFAVGYLLIRIIVPFLARTVTEIINTKDSKNGGQKEIPQEEVISEPKVFSWETYTNQRLNFQTSVPSGWNQKEYMPKNRVTGKTVVAFDPKKLPDSFTLASSYFAVAVTPVTNKDEFDKYKNNLSQIGNDNISESFLDGVRGYDTGSFISVEHKGYIYELILTSVRNVEGDFEYTEISQRGISSFKFIDQENAPNRIAGDIRVDNGSIIRLDKNGVKAVLVPKDTFKSVGITGFKDVKISPDGTLMCFIGNTNSSAVFLYYSGVSGKSPFQIAGSPNCVWSHDSKKIAFNNFVSDVSPVDVFLFNVENKEVKNLTRIVGGEYIRFYEIPEWSQDDSIIVSNFTAFDPKGENPSYTGSSVINVTTGEVTDK